MNLRPLEPSTFSSSAVSSGLKRPSAWLLNTKYIQLADIRQTAQLTFPGSEKSGRKGEKNGETKTVRGKRRANSNETSHISKREGRSNQPKTCEKPQNDNARKRDDQKGPTYRKKYPGEGHGKQLPAPRTEKGT